MGINPASFSYNGFDMGGLDVMRAVASVEGLDMPAVRTSDAALGGADGELGGIDTYGPRTITLSLELAEVTQEEWYATSGLLRTATARRSDDLPLTFQVDDSMPLMRVYCRPRRRNIPLNQRPAWANVTCDLQWYAPDPFIYSDAEHTGTTEAPSPAAGFSFPRAYPYTFGAPGSADVIDAFNAGDEPAPWTAIVYGPCDSPSIVGPGGSITWEGTLGDGESLHIDAHPSRQWLLVGGTSSQFELLSDDSTWWLLQPGSNNVVLNSGDGNGSVEFRWRDTYGAVV
jgi:hypothetical protein